MYKLHLILKYLRKRRIAWVSLIAVTLCTTMVLVVISVMGGWLRMFRESFHGLTGDVIVHGDLQGFPHYEEMIAKLEALAGVKAAVPTIDTFGLINIIDRSRQGVRVIGYPLERIGEVNAFPRSLYRQYQQYVDASENPKLPREQRAEAKRLADEGAKKASWEKPYPPEVYKSILPRSKVPVENWNGMIVGVGVLGLHKDRNGNWPERDGVYSAWAKLTVLGIDAGQGIDLAGQKTEESYWIIDDSRTQIWQYDQNSVYIPFENLQRNLSMDAREEIDPDTKQVTKVPARTRELQVAAKPGANLQDVKARVRKVVDEVMALHDAEDLKQPKPPNLLTSERYPIKVETWEESQATFIAAIEKEKALITFLFGMISIVAIFLIFCIFYMIVVEKTKDIGIIKSVGATNAGVAGIFLGYGLAIGIVGAGLGLLFGYLIVHNINYLHEQMGRLLNIQIWNPEVYAFDTIPNTMASKEVTIILIVAMISAVLGAMVPAIRAARMQPVEALRWE
ncbi:MAG: ABC transporter permease [Anaerolineae bacterium]|nr:ABC transporter permease [Phycisphaerae bacterium]